ncbi:lipase family protein [Mycolicibacter kumamotonensis]|uniref:lipase family protein n=1 Tax=Mycolicibacter kumamotonensis TaxID=354243 RepID=UPI0008066A9B|nr:lipase family protein [Mycolicibacter kumamotonensis]
MGFSASHARDVVLPLAQAAYTVMSGAAPALPTGFTQTALIETDPAHLAALPERHPAKAMAKDTNIFGLMGHDTASGTVFVSFRGSADVADWIADFDFLPAPYAPVAASMRGSQLRPSSGEPRWTAGFGQVHAGFQDVYGCVRHSIAANLPAAARGCQTILITGHSLGAALAVLAAPDVARTVLDGRTIEPRVTTFGGPRTGLPDFAAAFNAAIECCYRVVNFLDIVPLVPPSPYVHVGAEIAVDSGGAIDIGWRHSLAGYHAGLAALLAAQQ